MIDADTKCWRSSIVGKTLYSSVYVLLFILIIWTAAVFVNAVKLHYNEKLNHHKSSVWYQVALLLASLGFKFWLTNTLFTY